MSMCMLKRRSIHTSTYMYVYVYMIMSTHLCVRATHLLIWSDADTFRYLRVLIMYAQVCTVVCTNDCPYAYGCLSVLIVRLYVCRYIWSDADVCMQPVYMYVAVYVDAYVYVQPFCCLNMGVCTCMRTVLNVSIEVCRVLQVVCCEWCRCVCISE